MKLTTPDVLQLLAEIVPQSDTLIDVSTKLADLVLDSIDYVEIAIEVQGRCGVRLEQLPDLETSTVADLISCIESGQPFTGQSQNLTQF